MSSSSFIPIGTLWPTLQPKIGQSHFSAFQASKLYRGLRFGTHTYIVSVLTTTDFRHGWAIFGPLADKKHSEGGVSRAPSQRKVFWTFFQHALRYQFETWYIHLVGSATHQVKIFITVGSPWPTLQPRMVNVIFLHLWPQKLYRAFRFGTLWPISCSYPRHSQLTRHSLMLANGRISREAVSDCSCIAY